MEEKIEWKESDEREKSHEYGIWVGGIFVERISRHYEYGMMRRHFHSEYEIYYLLSGERYYFIDQRTYPVTSGTLVFVNKGQIHKTSMVRDPDHERILIQMKDNNISQLLEGTQERNLKGFFEKNSGILSLEGEDRKEVEMILKRIEAETLGGRYGAEGMVQALVAELLLYASRVQNERGKKESDEGEKPARHSKVQEVAEYISAHIQEPMSLESLADRFFVSKYYLCRIFKEITGFTVNEFINVTRVKYAASLLEREQWSITSVAEEVGYDSITYFERMFKQYLDMTPRQYKKRFAQSDREKK